MEKLQEFVNKLPDILKPWGEEMLLRYVDFTGRTDRKTFWTVILTNFVLSFVVGLLGVIPVIGTIIAGLWSIAFIVPGIAMMVRRLIDIGKTWPYIFFYFIPCAGPIILIVWFCKESA